MKPLIIWGAGGHAREVNFLCQRIGRRVLGFLDERLEWRGKVVDDLPVIGDIADVEASPEEVELVLAGVGDPHLKRRFLEKTRAHGYQLAAALIHPNVDVSPRNRVGPGSVICEGCTLTINITIGQGVIVNRATTIGHDVVVKDFATLSPGVNVSGNVTIGEGCFIGTGASIREKLTVGAWSVVGGGAFVAGHVPERVLYVGVPAAFKKALE